MSYPIQVKVTVGGKPVPAGFKGVMVNAYELRHIFEVEKIKDLKDDKGFLPLPIIKIPLEVFSNIFEDVKVEYGTKEELWPEEAAK